LKQKNNESFKILEVDCASGTLSPAEENTMQKRNRFVSILLVGEM
jgi:hypothetical protein